jgi:hypothetical protein
MPRPPPRRAPATHKTDDIEKAPSADYCNRARIASPSEESVGHGSMFTMVSNTSSRSSGTGVKSPSEESVDHGSMHTMMSNASSWSVGTGVSHLSYNDAGSILRYDNTLHEPTQTTHDSRAGAAKVLLHLNPLAPHISLYHKGIHLVI